MNTPTPAPQEPLQKIPVPADIGQPDKIAFGLTGKQLLIAAAGAAACYGILHAGASSWRFPFTVAGLTPVAAVTVALIVVHRDGQSLDAWLYAAVRFFLSPQRFTAHPARRLPAWAPPGTGEVAVAGLRLPAQAITPAGTVAIDTGLAVLVASSTVNLLLRNDSEQAMLLHAYSRWLNSLTHPVQITVCAQRLDLQAFATHLITSSATALADPALRQAATGYAAFLAQLSREHDLRTRSIITTITVPHSQRESDALQAAAQSAAALAGLGTHTKVLDGPAAIAVLQTCTDPFGPAHATWPRAVPETPITSPVLRPGAYPSEGPST
jgi:hypothetical protein